MTINKENYILYNKTYSLKIINDTEIEYYDKIHLTREIIPLEKVSIEFIFYKMQDYTRIKASFMINDLHENVYYILICKVVSADYDYLNGFYVQDKNMQPYFAMSMLPHNIERIEDMTSDENNLIFGYRGGRGTVSKQDFHKLFMEDKNFNKYTGTHSILWQPKDKVRHRIYYDDVSYIGLLMSSTKQLFASKMQQYLKKITLIFIVSIIINILMLKLLSEINNTAFFFYKVFSLLFFHYATYYFVDKLFEEFFNYIIIDRGKILMFRLYLFSFSCLYMIFLNILFSFNLSLLIFLVLLNLLYTIIVLVCERQLLTFISVYDLKMLEHKVFQTRSLKRTKLFLIDTVGVMILVLSGLLL